MGEAKRRKGLDPNFGEKVNIKVLKIKGIAREKDIPDRWHHLTKIVPNVKILLVVELQIGKIIKEFNFALTRKNDELEAYGIAFESDLDLFTVFVKRNMAQINPLVCQAYIEAQLTNAVAQIEHTSFYQSP